MRQQLQAQTALYSSCVLSIGPTDEVLPDPVRGENTDRCHCKQPQEGVDGAAALVPAAGK